jgi:hypothetical protein
VEKERGVRKVGWKRWVEGGEMEGGEWAYLPEGLDVRRVGAHVLVAGDRGRESKG